MGASRTLQNGARAAIKAHGFGFFLIKKKKKMKVSERFLIKGERGRREDPALGSGKNTPKDALERECCDFSLENLSWKASGDVSLAAPKGWIHDLGGLGTFQPPPRPGTTQLQPAPNP